MTDKNECPRCGSDEMAPGCVQSSGRVYFRPDKANFFALKTADLSVKAIMCMACGSIELRGDIKKARSLVPSTP